MNGASGHDGAGCARRPASTDAPGIDRGTVAQRGANDLVALVAEGTAAFRVRAASARRAARRLDLQYYMWRSDLTGRLLARETLAAADRGVAVRLLLDDVYAPGRERTLAALDEHPRIAVRLFNGTRWRRFGALGFPLELAFGGWHLNRRMHNKSWIADGCLAVVGGRNIGDEYFDLQAEDGISFRDLDLVIAGGAAAQAQAVFETYWSSPLARPAATTAAAAARSGLPALRESLAAAGQAPEAQALLGALHDDPLDHVRGSLVPTPSRSVHVIADRPEKARRGLGARKRARAAGGIAAEIADALRQARREVLLISPYLVPGRAGLALLGELRARGVRICAVTNSLGATDVVAVHGGYAKYRRAMLRMGIDLHELKPDADGGPASLLGSRGAALHTKAVAIDGALAFVGSFNLDPRSAALNTEMGAFVRHPALAQAVADEYARLTDPSVSWRVVLQDGRLNWCDRAADGARCTDQEPRASWIRRVMASLIRRLPVEEQL
ncbi:phospholipase D family protein [Roseomonas fluvialis]|uniref:Phospholipase D n=1 Tax=Roseomonas fluvialis TaxID=1750527 RepID=A0ABN6PAB5_9PROT|nr:phospholipase D family protein [Roseomonas fluvialis]BDG74584.1 phospholipase D family protein [Roseomonas fluvialis]